MYTQQYPFKFYSLELWQQASILSPNPFQTQVAKYYKYSYMPLKTTKGFSHTLFA